MKLKFKKLHVKAIIPKYQSELASGFDLHALYSERIPGTGKRMINTGLAVQIPLGFELQIRPRSGLSLDFPSYIANSPGTIDADYRGEIRIMVINHTPYTWEIKEGQRIAQAVLARTFYGVIEVVDELDSTERGAGGFGSTGTN